VGSQGVVVASETTDFIVGASNALVLALLTWAIIGATIYRLASPLT
jgi:hypothetical protein